MKRFFKFTETFLYSIVLNIIIVSTAFFLISAVCAFFEISLDDHPLTFYLIFYACIGMGGAFVSLWLSRIIAKKIFKIRLLQFPFQSQDEERLYQLVASLSRRAGLTTTPEVGIYDSAEINAFATGPSRKRSLVAFSTALLNNMDNDEVEGVLAHEISHIANGDMVTMCVVQGIVNTMVLLLARLLTMAVTSRMERRSFWVEICIFMFFQSILNLLGSILIVNVFSKMREFRADQGAAKLAGKSKILKSLQKLQTLLPQMTFDKKNASYNTLKITTAGKQSLFARLLSTHPPLQSRIERIKKMQNISY